MRWKDQVLEDLGKLGFELGMAEDIICLPNSDFIYTEIYTEHCTMLCTSLTGVSGGTWLARLKSIREFFRQTNMMYQLSELCPSLRPNLPCRRSEYSLLSEKLFSYLQLLTIIILSIYWVSRNF